jgi:hypothetical protein
MSTLSLQECELLRYACCAIGRIPNDIDEQGAWFKVQAHPIIGHAWTCFNPLRSNNDAFALMVQLRMTVEPYKTHRDEWGVRASCSSEWHVALVTDKRDLFASARLAVVELAAQLYRIQQESTT